jgi:hypothetical protein
LRPVRTVLQRRKAAGGFRPADGLYETALYDTRDVRHSAEDNTVGLGHSWYHIVRRNRLKFTGSRATAPILHLQIEYADGSVA